MTCIELNRIFIIDKEGKSIHSQLFQICQYESFILGSEKLIYFHNHHISDTKHFLLPIIITELWNLRGLREQQALTFYVVGKEAKVKRAKWSAHSS